MNKATQAYLQTKVSTTDQGQLLLMLYDGALKFLQQAREKMLEKDYAAKGLLISKVIDIVNELSNTLNLEKGGTLAENLNNLYFLCTTRLLQANLKMNVEQLDGVAEILSGLRSAYAEIITTPEARQISAQIATKMNADASMLQRAAIPTSPATRVPMPGQLGRMQARAAYGQGVQAQPMEQAAPVLAATVAPAPDLAAAPALAATVSQAAKPLTPASPPATAEAPTQRAAQPMSKPAVSTPIDAPRPSRPSQGFGGTSFAQLKAYGK